MKVSKYFAIVPLVLSLAGFAQAKTSTYTVPFYNIVINSGDAIHANYSFVKATQGVACTSDTKPTAEVGWLYQGTEYTAQFKYGQTLTLKDNPSFQGYTADPTGPMAIENKAMDGTTLVVSCVIKKLG